VAYVFGTRKSEVPKELRSSLGQLELSIVVVFSEDNFAYRKAVLESILQTGRGIRKRSSVNICLFVQGLNV
jgi:hypothetical protein